MWILFVEVALRGETSGEALRVIWAGESAVETLKARESS
jgi:hypothetical protein